MQQEKRATSITFFDLKSNLPKQSPWCWRIRLVLNYKNLKYKTQFVEGADIRTVSLQNEFEPTATNSDGSPRYTLPALIDETDTSKPAIRISDSERIVLYLERTYPDANKPLFPSPFPPHNPNPALYLLLKQYTASALMPYINPLIVEEMISKMDKKAMEKVKERLKVKNGTDDVGSFSVRDSEKEDTWKKLEEGFGLIDSLLKMGEEMRRFPDPEIENSDGRFEFFMGGQITYADLFMCGTLIMIQTASPEIVWGRIKTWNGGRWEKFLASMEPYMIVC
ncbi:hypothetical protein ABKN59_007086 [Abortiporus biennis]